MLDLSRIIKENRLTKIVLENSLIGPDIINRLKHIPENIIDLNLNK